MLSSAYNQNIRYVEIFIYTLRPCSYSKSAFMPQIHGYAHLWSLQQSNHLHNSAVITLTCYRFGLSCLLLIYLMIIHSDTLLSSPMLQDMKVHRNVVFSQWTFHLIIQHIVSEWTGLFNFFFCLREKVPPSLHSLTTHLFALLLPSFLLLHIFNAL